MDDMSPLMNIHDMHFVHTDRVLALKNQLTFSNGSHKDPTNMYGPCWRLDELGSISIKEFSNESGPMMVEICILLFYSPFLSCHHPLNQNECMVWRYFRWLRIYYSFQNDCILNRRLTLDSGFNMTGVQIFRLYFLNRDDFLSTLSDFIFIYLIVTSKSTLKVYIFCLNFSREMRLFDPSTSKGVCVCVCKWYIHWIITVSCVARRKKIP